jgi:hypothetical protein
VWIQHYSGLNSNLPIPIYSSMDFFRLRLEVDGGMNT